MLFWVFDACYICAERKYLVFLNNYMILAPLMHTKNLFIFLFCFQYLDGGHCYITSFDNNI